MSSVMTLYSFVFCYQCCERTFCLQLHLLTWVCR